MPEHWWLDISPEGVGTIGMAINFAVALAVSPLTVAPPGGIAGLVESIRVPHGAGEAHEIGA